MDWHAEAKILAEDFVKVAKIAGIEITFADIDIDVRPAPHERAGRFSKGKMAVYIFIYKDRVLKVGKAGPKDASRFYHHHYAPKSSNSNLAKSLIKEGSKSEIPGASPDEIGNLMKEKFARINYLLDAEEWGDFTLSLFEAFLHCRLKPKYEGKR